MLVHWLRHILCLWIQFRFFTTTVTYHPKVFACSVLCCYTGVARSYTFYTFCPLHNLCNGSARYQETKIRECIAHLRFATEISGSQIDRSCTTPRGQRGVGSETSSKKWSTRKAFLLTAETSAFFGLIVPDVGTPTLQPRFFGNDYSVNGVPTLVHDVLIEVCEACFLRYRVCYSRVYPGRCLERGFAHDERSHFRTCLHDYNVLRKGTRITTTK